MPTRLHSYCCVQVIWLELSLVVKLLSQTMVYRHGHDVIGVARKADKKADKKKKPKKKKPTVRCGECEQTRADWENVDMSHTDIPFMADYKLGRINHLRFERA